MRTFFKVQTASLTASIIDFSLTIICVQILGIWYISGNVIGTISGAISNFLLSRHWVFRTTARRVKSQIIRYAIVWTGYILLVTSGIYILTHYGGVNYVLSKILTAGLIGIPYNYFLQKKFIFL